MVMPICGTLPKNPRCSFGAYSVASSSAPPHSPPMPSPWISLSSIRSSGAATPICAYEGSRQIHAVASPIMQPVKHRYRSPGRGKLEQQPDTCSRNPPHAQSDDECLLASDPVTDMSEYHSAERTDEERQCQSKIGKQCRNDRILCHEELAVEY